MTKETAGKKDIVFVSEDADHVSCNGGGGALGHPKVYYTFDGKDEIVCGYCGRIYQRKKAA